MEVVLLKPGDDDLVSQCASLLATQWPSTPAPARSRTIAGHLDARRGDVGVLPLPAHFAVLSDGIGCGGGGDGDGAAGSQAGSTRVQVLGHAQLQRASDAGDAANAVLVHSVVVDARARRRGVGTALMRALEAAAAGAGHSAVFLSTPDMQAFYRALGYVETDAAPPAAAAAAASMLSSESRDAIEGALARRFARMVGGGNDGGGSVHRPGATWMRRRLRAFNAPEPLPRDAAALAARACELVREGEGDGGSGNGETARLLLRDVAWERQIGPTCGLCALRMAARAVAAAAPGALDELLEAAHAAGDTNDGEMFSAAALQRLARARAGVAAARVRAADLTPRALRRALARGALLLVPYDRSLANHEPVLKLGALAHWCVVVGVQVASARGRGGVVWLHGADVTSDPASGAGGVGNASGGPEHDATRAEEVWDRGDVEGIGAADDGGDPVVLCQHSMSRTRFAVRWSALRESNAQLVCAKPSVSAHLAHTGGPALSGEVVVVAAGDSALDRALERVARMKDA